MNIFVCDSCGSTFFCSYESEQCPDCGANTIRPANEVECDEYLAAKARGAIDQTYVSYFAPVTATQMECFKLEKVPIFVNKLDRLMFFEIIMELESASSDSGSYTVNAWAREHGGNVSSLLLSHQIPRINNEPFEDLMKRSTDEMANKILLYEKLHDFALSQVKDDLEN